MGTFEGGLIVFCRNLGVGCGGLKENDSCRFVGLNTWSPFGGGKEGVEGRAFLENVLS